MNDSKKDASDDDSSESELEKACQNVHVNVSCVPASNIIWCLCWVGILCCTTVTGPRLFIICSNIIKTVQSKLSLYVMFIRF